MTHILLRLQYKIVNKTEDDAIWLEIKNGTFSIKSLYSIIECGEITMFSYNGCLGSVTRNETNKNEKGKE